VSSAVATQLPNFLGIGVPRAGTTWLHELLHDHPRVFVPDGRKELHYFDVNFERGVEWYAHFFPPAGRFDAVGEITPHYLFCEPCLDRIAAMPSVERLIVLLRNPTHRAYSHYGLALRNWNYRGTFREFLRDEPRALAWGRYAGPLRRYLQQFGRDRVLILVQEIVTRDVPSLKRELASFLRIDISEFPEMSGQRVVNQSFVPRARGAYALAMHGVKWLKRRDMDWALRLARRLGVKQLLSGGGTRVPPLSVEDERYLNEFYADDIAAVESVIAKPLEVWRVS
jgi:hypothetical protein